MILVYARSVIFVVSGQSMDTVHLCVEKGQQMTSQMLQPDKEQEEEQEDDDEVAVGREIVGGWVGRVVCLGEIHHKKQWVINEITPRLLHQLS